MARKQENLIVSLVVNIVLPVIILTRLTESLGPALALALAVSAPIAYGVIDYIRRREASLFSVLGLLNVALTGGIGLLQLNPDLVAIKEAGFPLLIGLVLLASQKTKSPIVPRFFAQVFAMERIRPALATRGTEASFERRMRIASTLFAVSFFISSALNYALARLIVHSSPGTAAFNEEIGIMTGLSYPAIAVPMMAILAVLLFWLSRGISRDTGIPMEALFASQKKNEKPEQ